MERCSLCILPRTDYFSFDKDGVCVLCSAAKRAGQATVDAAKNAAVVEEYVEKMKRSGRGAEFDCVMGISGGRDSCYLLYLLVKKHNLRCLATYYRPPFTPDAIDANVRRLTQKLDVPLMELKIPVDYHIRIARELSVLWAKKPTPLIANMTCAPCKLIHRDIYKIAKSKNVKAVVFGGNRFEMIQLSSGAAKIAVTNTVSRAKEMHKLRNQLRKHMGLVGKGINALRGSWELWRYVPLGVKASVMYMSPHTPFIRSAYPNITCFEYFYHADWDETECNQALKEQGWELPPHAHSYWRADCTFAEIKNLMFRKMTGMTYMDAFLSNMVRAGVLSREEALKRVEIEGKPSPERLLECYKVLDLPEKCIRALEGEERISGL